MVEEKKNTVFNFEGSSMNQRFIPLLDPNNVKIDNRTLADFLVFAEKYADYVYAHQLQNIGKSEKDRILTWKSFFNSDISVFLANVLSIDLKLFLPFYINSDSAIDYASQKEHLQQRLDSIAEFVMKISNSYHALLSITDINPQIKNVLNHIEQIVINGNISNIVDAASKFGLLHNLSKDDKFIKVFGSFSKNEFNKNEPTVNDLVKLFNDFFVIARKLILYCKQVFESSIKDYQSHSPAIALYISFLKLYEFVQADLNKITSRHLDYFYKELLQQNERKSKPDYVHVCFTLDDHVHDYKMNQGTLFSAGIDAEGYDCLYQADDFLTINKTKVKQLATLYIPQIDEIGLEDNYEYSSSIFQSELKKSSAGGFDFSLNPISFSGFDANKANPDFTKMVQSEIGFAIASPILLLSEGKRACTLTLRFNIKSLSPLLLFVERYTKNKKTSFDSAFHQLFFRAFILNLSTADGWFQVESFKILAPDPITGTFKLFFELPKGAPSIVPMGGDKWDENEMAEYNTEWPILKCCLTNKYSMYMYTYLKELLLVECGINVCVSGVKNLQIFNDLGQLDISTPFYPFGTSPVIGSSLLIGNEELLKKNIDDLSFELGWYNLPKKQGGFKSYYQEYDNTIDTNSFKVAVTNLSEYEFHPISKEKIQQYSLFRDEVIHEGQLPVIANTTLLEGFEINNLKVNSDKSNVPLAPYSVTVKSGYIRFELVSPEMGFGQSIYPSLFSDKILKGIKSSKIELPNTPYIPQLNSITLNYSASTKINFEGSSFVKSDPRVGEKMFLVRPFGVQTIFQNSRHYSTCFLPQYFHNGYLLLGLDEVVLNEPLTFYFSLEPCIGNEFEVDLPQIEWFYVANDVMVPFQKKDIIFDTTNNFTTSGIVKINMPIFMDNQNSILPGGSYWIVAAMKGDLDLIAKLKGVYTQALQLTWTSNKKGAFWTKSIPKNTIESLLVSNKEIVSIIQPESSFGGRNAESNIDFYTRVSERLRHRNRCITAWDYERMILEEFPGVSQVKCVTPVMCPDNVSAGEILIIVVPHRVDDSPRRFNYDILQSIKKFVIQCASPFVTIQVINPVYEDVKVTASVRFSEGYEDGTGVEKLNRDIIQFVCPWMVDDSREMQFGGSIDLDKLESFIYALPYVHMVTNLSLLVLHYHDKKYSISDSVVINRDNKNIYASKPWSVLISMKQHVISIIDRDMFISPKQAAISNLRLGNEFVLVEKKDPELKGNKLNKIKNSSGRYVSIDIEF